MLFLQFKFCNSPSISLFLFLKYKSINVLNVAPKLGRNLLFPVILVKRTREVDYCDLNNGNSKTPLISATVNTEGKVI